MRFFCEKLWLRVWSPNPASGIMVWPKGHWKRMWAKRHWHSCLIAFQISTLGEARDKRWSHNIYDFPLNSDISHSNYQLQGFLWIPLEKVLWCATRCQVPGVTGRGNREKETGDQRIGSSHQGNLGQPGSAATFRESRTRLRGARKRSKIWSEIQNLIWEPRSHLRSKVSSERSHETAAA